MAFGAPGVPIGNGVASSACRTASLPVVIVVGPVAIATADASTAPSALAPIACDVITGTAMAGAHIDSLAAVAALATSTGSPDGPMAASNAETSLTAAAWPPPAAAVTEMAPAKMPAG